MEDNGSYDEITQAIEEKLVPTFEMLGKMLKEIDDKASAAIKRCEDIITCMSDAVMGQKRGEFEGLLSSKYSADLGPLDEFYSDTMGNKFSDQLIDELMSTDVENPDEYISGKINETKSKYGKYLGPKPEAAPESPAEEAAEPAAEQGPAEEAGETHTEGEPAVVAEKVEVKKKKKPSSQDMADLLGLRMSKV